MVRTRAGLLMAEKALASIREHILSVNVFMLSTDETEQGFSLQVEFMSRFL